MAQDSPSGSFVPLVNPAPGLPFTSAELRKISSIHLHPEIAFLQVLTVRSCTNRLKPFQQSTKSSNNTNSLGRADRSLIIFGKPAGIVEPSQGTFNDPPLWQDLPFGFYECGNINTQAQFPGNILLKRLAVSCIGTEALNGWILLKGVSCCQNT